MSITATSAASAASGIFQSATTALATPSAALSSFDPAATSTQAPKPAKAGGHHGHHLHDQTQGALLQLQQNAQSGALSTDLTDVLGT